MGEIMSAGYRRIKVPPIGYGLEHPIVRIDDDAERKQIQAQMEEHLPGVYFRGTNPQLRQHPSNIKKAGKLSAAKPDAGDYTVTDKNVEVHRAGANNSKLISLSQSASVASAFASSYQNPNMGWVYCIRFDKNAENFCSHELDDPRLALVGEMEAFAVNEIPAKDIISYYSYNVHAGIGEIYLSEDLSDAEQEKILCNLLTGLPTTDDPKVTRDIAILMKLREEPQAYLDPTSDAKITATHPVAATPKVEKSIPLKTTPSQAPVTASVPKNPTTTVVPTLSGPSTSIPDAPIASNDIHQSQPLDTGWGWKQRLGYGVLAVGGVVAFTASAVLLGGLPLIAAAAVSVGVAAYATYSLGAGERINYNKKQTATTKAMEQQIAKQADKVTRRTEEVAQSRYHPPLGPIRSSSSGASYNEARAQDANASLHPGTPAPESSQQNKKLG